MRAENAHNYSYRAWQSRSCCSSRSRYSSCISSNCWSGGVWQQIKAAFSQSKREQINADRLIQYTAKLVLYGRWRRLQNQHRGEMLRRGGCSRSSNRATAAAAAAVKPGTSLPRFSNVSAAVAAWLPPDFDAGPRCSKHISQLESDFIYWPEPSQGLTSNVCFSKYQFNFYAATP